MPQDQKRPAKNLLLAFMITACVLLAAAFLLLFPPTFPRGAEDIPAKTDMEMVFVPAGDFLMGDEDLDPNNRPQHTVYLDAYWIDQTEVTNAQYLACIQDGGCRGAEPSQYIHEESKRDHPVIQVTWQDAVDFCEWAGKSLPTEAQWEKAARGTDGRLYPWGDKPPNPRLANYNQNESSSTPVGSYPLGASPYGALDMAGNVSEWTADWYSPDYYENSPRRNPRGPETGERHVKRGGTWFITVDFVLRAAFRKYTGSDRSYHIGFRCAYELN